jgi:hypothetical protein
MSRAAKRIRDGLEHRLNALENHGLLELGSLIKTFASRLELELCMLDMCTYHMIWKRIRCVYTYPYNAVLGMGRS